MKKLIYANPYDFNDSPFLDSSSELGENEVIVDGIVFDKNILEEWRLYLLSLDSSGEGKDDESISDSRPLSKPKNR